MLERVNPGAKYYFGTFMVARKNAIEVGLLCINPKYRLKEEERKISDFSYPCSDDAMEIMELFDSFDFIREMINTEELSVFIKRATIRINEKYSKLLNKEFVDNKIIPLILEKIRKQISLFYDKNSRMDFSISYAMTCDEMDELMKSFFTNPNQESCNMTDKNEVVLEFKENAEYILAALTIGNAKFLLNDKNKDVFIRKYAEKAELDVEKLKDWFNKVDNTFLPNNKIAIEVITDKKVKELIESGKHPYAQNIENAGLGMFGSNMNPGFSQPFYPTHPMMGLNPMSSFGSMPTDPAMIDFVRNSVGALESKISEIDSAIKKITNKIDNMYK